MRGGHGHATLQAILFMEADAQVGYETAAVTMISTRMSGAPISH